MSYSEIGLDCDIRLIPTVVYGKKVIQCIGCRIAPSAPSPYWDDCAGTVMHLNVHIGKGHKVPGRLFIEVMTQGAVYLGEIPEEEA